MLRVALWTIGLAFGGMASAQEDDPGFELYQRHCRTCHVLAPGDHRLGPSLYGVVGRKAGTAEGFGYSGVMRRAQVVWDAGALDAFLADPTGFLPGNAMLYPGMGDSADRAALIAYLAGQG